MAGFRLSPLAEADLVRILVASANRWGPEGRRRYAALLAAAMRLVARVPDGPTTRDRAELSPGIRSFHIRHVPGSMIRKPVHILYYRATAPDRIEIVRVLHERMEPSRHLTET